MCQWRFVRWGQTRKLDRCETGTWWCTFWFSYCFCTHTRMHTHTHPHTFNLPFPGLPRWAGSRKVKPIWILLKQERVSGSGISWAMYESAPHSRQITTPEPHHSVFYWLYALPAAQPTASKLWRHMMWDLLFLHIIPETISADHYWLFLWFLVSDSCHKCSNVPVLISCYQWHQEPECVPGQNYSRGLLSLPCSTVWAEAEHRASKLAHAGHRCAQSWLEFHSNFKIRYGYERVTDISYQYDHCINWIFFAFTSVAKHPAWPQVPT